MPLYEFKCVRCGSVKEELFPTAEETRAIYCDGPHCKPMVPGGRCRMVKQVSTSSFAIHGFNAKNGYSTGGGPA